MASSRILAAGGLLWRDAERSRLAVVHRHRYDDWSLPKGKLRTDERFMDGARREVEEETGWRAELEDFAGEVFYRVGERPKSVLFWHMRALGDGPTGAPDPDEVSEVVWLSIAEARARLSYEVERDLLPG